MNRRRFLATLLAVPLAVRLRLPVGKLVVDVVKPIPFIPTPAQQRFFDESHFWDSYRYLHGDQWPNRVMFMGGRRSGRSAALRELARRNG